MTCLENGVATEDREKQGRVGSWSEPTAKVMTVETVKTEERSSAPQRETAPERHCH